MVSQKYSKFQHKKVKLGDGDGLGLDAVSEILREANEEILFEILVRIPNCRSAIISSSVCNRWHSLISHPLFISRFITHHNQHQDRFPPPYTIIFRKSEQQYFGSAVNFQPICKLFSEESLFLHGKSSTSSNSYLDFLPSPMVVRASCNDLLLLSDGSRVSGDFYICNPVTKQLYHLPVCRWFYEPIKISIQGYALARITPDFSHFKVVLLHHPFYDPSPEDSHVFQDMTIYCSNLGNWKRGKIIIPRPKILALNCSLDVVACNGILYWFEYEQNVDRVISLDLSRIQLDTECIRCSFIDFPNDFWWFQSEGCVREQIGVVGGELRLLQVVLQRGKNKLIVYLKVWKLDSSSLSWVLLHDKRYAKRPKAKLVAFLVHPTNGDMVFMVWGESVYRYNLMTENSYELVEVLQEPFKRINYTVYGQDIDRVVSFPVVDQTRLMSFPMVHPTWPTSLP